MNPKNPIKVALIGNPNTGKSSIFNTLTGLHQKVGNYPGITVEQKVGFCHLNTNRKAEITDLPGTYSLNASSMDENLVIELLMNKKHPSYPDVIVFVADVEHLKRNLLLFTQIKDLEIPTILVINMEDRLSKKGITIDIPKLEKALKTKIILTNCKNRKGIDDIKKEILNYEQINTKQCINPLLEIDFEYFSSLQKTFSNESIYKLWILIIQDASFVNLKRKKVISKDIIPIKSNDYLKKLLHKETIKRYQFINECLKESYKVDSKNASSFQKKIDDVLLHPFWGYAIFFLLLVTIFQIVYSWSSVPMDFIDSSFVELSGLVKSYFPSGMFTDLLSEGIIPGIAGVCIFIPQIAFLFLFISILEETGYMSRVVFLMDKILKPYGLSGKSVIPLMSGTACAIPAIMSARNIENWKERFISILVIPFTTCSARLPIYLIIISLVIPDKNILGINYQGLTLMFLYLLGFFMSLLSAMILNKLIKYNFKSYFVIEIPNYKFPSIKDILIYIFGKIKSFVLEAGKIIIALSIILWGLASFGPGNDLQEAEKRVKEHYSDDSMTEEEIAQQVTSYKLEHSFIGILGKSIEPVIKPLGYDWKIGIAIITSVAAREVFVGTLATIYNVGDDNQSTIKKRMLSEKNKQGEYIYNFATGISLLIFYAFAMQCISTLAIVKKETNSWKWPIIQLVSMTSFAYLAAFVTYQILK